MLSIRVIIPNSPKKILHSALPTGKHQGFCWAQNSNFPNFLRFTWDHHVIHCGSHWISRGSPGSLVIVVWQIPFAPEWRSRNPTADGRRSWVNASDAPKKRRLCYWKWWKAMDWPIKMVIVHASSFFFLCLAKGTMSMCVEWEFGSVF